MPKPRFSEPEIIAILKEAEAGASLPDLLRRHGVDRDTYSSWKARYRDALRPEEGSTLAHPAEVWNSRYDTEEYLFGTAPNGWLRDHAHIWAPGSRVLCVADGEGRNSVFLAGRGLRVDAFDPAANAVAKARHLTNERGVTVQFSVADCDTYPWPEAAYDGVAAIFVQFADPPLRTRLFAHIVRALKPGGTLILQGYTPKQLEYGTGGPSQPSHLYTDEMLRKAFAELRILELREYEAELREGTGHLGRSALIGLVAERPHA